MSYVYSNGLCREALNHLTSNDPLESRLVKAFSEMGVANYGDTSDEIWKKWKELENRYNKVAGEIHLQRQEGNVIEGTPQELIDFQDALIELINDWLRFNNNEISNNRLKKS